MVPWSISSRVPGRRILLNMSVKLVTTIIRDTMYLLQIQRVSQSGLRLRSWGLFAWNSWLNLCTSSCILGATTNTNNRCHTSRGLKESNLLPAVNTDSKLHHHVGIRLEVGRLSLHNHGSEQCPCYSQINPSSHYWKVTSNNNESYPIRYVLK